LNCRACSPRCGGSTYRELQLTEKRAPGSKLATARGLDAETTGNTLGQELGLTDVEAEALYAALDWLEAR